MKSDRKPGNAPGDSPRTVPAAVRQLAAGARRRSDTPSGKCGGRLSSAMLCIASLLGGCAVMSESECLTADWHAVGERDGRDGRVMAHLEKYYDACAQFGVYPDDDAYREGREQGLTFYCTEDGGYQEGRIGQGYRGVCPVTLEPYFLEGYNVGISVRQTLESVHRLDYGISSAREELKSLEDEIEELESGDDRQASEKEDRSAAGKLKEMYRQLGRLEAELERLRNEKVYAIVAYRRAVDVARSRGFYEHYEY